MASINDLDEFKKSAYSRIVLDEYDYCCSFALPSRKVSMAAYTNSGLRELSSMVCVKIAEFHDNLESLVNRCCAENKISESTPMATKLAKLDEDFNKFKLTDGYYGSNTCHDSKITCRKPMTEFVNGIRSFFNSVDQTILTAKNAVAVSKTSEKFNPATIETVIKNTTNDIVDSGFVDFTDEKFKGKDIFTKENMEIVIRKLNSLKSVVSTAVKKNFGDDTEFKDMKIVDIITSK